MSLRVISYAPVPAAGLGYVGGRCIVAAFFLGALFFGGIPLAGVVRIAGGEEKQQPEQVSDTLPDEELRRRREALDGWAFEPVALEGSAFVFHLDRRDGSWFFQDRRTGVKWFSSSGRRGIASVLVGQPGPVPVEGGTRPSAVGRESRWVPVDRVENLQAEDRRIRFRGASSPAAIPDVRFEIEKLASDQGVAIRFELPAAPDDRSAPDDKARSREAILAVRLLDEALGIADADGGGVSVPRGMGEWHPVDAADDLLIELGPPDPGAGGTGPAGSAERPLELPYLSPTKASNPILVRWLDPTAKVRVERRAVAGVSFPGLRGMFTSFEIRSANGVVELRTLGKEWSPVVDGARAYFALSSVGAPKKTLRQKAGVRQELQGFPGAAVFRPEIGERWSFEAVASYAEGIRRDLGIDQAAFVLRGWAAGGKGGEDLRSFQALGAAGGNEALARSARRLKDLGFIFGLEIDLVAADLSGAAPAGATADTPGAAGAGAAVGWNGLLETAKSGQGFTALIEHCAPQLLLFRGGPRPRAGQPGQAVRDHFASRTAFGCAAAEAFGLAAFLPGAEADLDCSAYLEGLSDGYLADPRSRTFWPIFTAAYGHSVRLGSSPARALRPDDPAGFLALLLLGEVPVYELPFEPEGKAQRDGPRPEDREDSRLCLARDEGWAAGKGLSRHHIFLKNTYEVASHLARIRFRETLLYHRALVADASVRETFFGPDLRIVVNFGPAVYEDAEDGFAIPAGGFVVRHPFLYAFHALRVGEVSYERPAFFVVRPLEGKMYLRAERTLIYHGFGPSQISLGGKTFDVDREAVVKIW